MSSLIPNHDSLLNDPWFRQREMDARVEEEDDLDEEADDPCADDGMEDY